MIVEAITVTLYRVASGRRPKGWRKGKPRRQKALAYRDAAWAKLRARCGCVLPDGFAESGERKMICRYHDKEFRVTPGGQGVPWEDPPCFVPPRIWGLPRSDEDGYWDYGRAVAFRLARFYRYLDSRPAPTTTGDRNGR